MPAVSPERELAEFAQSREAYRLRAGAGVECILTAPITENLWMYDARGRCRWTQPSVLSQWSSYLSRMARFYEEDFGEAWRPPSFEEGGARYYWSRGGV